MRLALFFSHGISLKNWEDIGHLNREAVFYNKISNNFEEITIFTYGGKQDLRYQSNFEPKIKIFPKPWGLPPILYGFLLPFIHWQKLQKIDILKTNQMSAALPAVIAKLCWRKKKLIVRNGYEWLKILENEKKPWWKKTIVYCWEKIAYKAADIVIFTSQKDKEFAQKKFKIPERKIKFIPNYIDTELFKPLNVPKERNSVIYVGRLSKEKNLFNLIEAMAGLPSKITVVGQGSLQNDLEQFAKEKGVSLEFKGKIANQDLSQELNRHEIFVLPSFYEGCPKALLEAMACGLPCVASDVEGIKEIVKHKENGYLCQTDANSIRSALIEVLNNKPLQEKMGQEARETIAENFSLEKIIQKEIALFSDLKVLVLAGGKGMRLWPLSREQKPKQFQKLVSTKTMLQETVWRLVPDVSWNDIFIATNIQYKDEVQAELPKLPKENIIVEPMSRERMASLLLFLVFLPREFYGKPVLVLPSDHSIKNIELFKRAVWQAQEFIRENPDYILALSAKPVFPDTGLGYIKKGKALLKKEFEICQAEAFVEKPNLQRASGFLQEGNYFWNTAIYLFTPELILQQIKKFVPDNYQRFLNIQKSIGKPDFKKVLDKEYSEMDQIPLEFSVLENYSKVAVLGLEMGWSDVGSWSVLKDCLSGGKGNFAKGNHIDLDSENVMVFGSNDKQLVATAGVRDLVIVVTEDIVLVCNKNESQKVKQLAEKLEKEQKFKYL